MKEVVKEINQFCKNHIYRLNSGGCGFFALYVGEQLRDKGEDFKILIVRDSECEGRMFFHILVQCGEFIFDGRECFSTWEEWEKFYDDKCYFLAEVIHELSYEDYIHFFNDIKFWSKGYCQEQNPKLKKGIKEKFDLWYVCNN